jgi:isoleucyl-tRNA synthetase
MDTYRQHGKALLSFPLVQHSTCYQGIAVHNDLTYSVLRHPNQEASGSRLVIVAKDRMEALADILGEVENVAEVKGLV